MVWLIDSTQTEELLKQQVRLRIESPYIKSIKLKIQYTQEQLQLPSWKIPQTMFQTTLTHYQSKLPLPPSTSSTYTCINTSTDLDLQYQLYSRYMHMSKEQLAIQELMLMKDSQILIESIGLNNNSKADLSRDVHSTMDSMCCDEEFENSLVHEFSDIERRSPKKITRKSTRQSILKPMGRGSQDFTEILNEIQRNCSQQTLNSVKTLVSEHKKHLTKIMEVEKKQKNLRRLSEKMEKVEQENAIFRMKLGEVEDKIKGKEEEIRWLKEKLSQLRMGEKENMIRSQKRLLLSPSITSNTKPTTQDHPIPSPLLHPNPTISQYLNQKQSHLTQRLQQIQSIQHRIQHLIETAVMSSSTSENSDECNKCCVMIKKIKDSVMRYRQYLEQEGEECERLYNMLKAELEQCLVERKMDIVNV